MTNVRNDIIKKLLEKVALGINSCNVLIGKETDYGDESEKYQSYVTERIQVKEWLKCSLELLVEVEKLLWARASYKNVWLLTEASELNPVHKAPL